MEDIKGFKSSLERAADFFKSIPRTERVKIVSHLDADGIAACSIIANALNNEGYDYIISIVQQLEFSVIEDLKDDSIGCYIFSDLGSGHVSVIRKEMAGKKVIILDHHEMEEGITAENSHGKDLVFVNPHIFGVDGNKGISGAGVSYLFSKFLNAKNKSMAHIAIIGAIGDIQENNGFKDLNKEILDDAVKQKKISVEKNLRLYGRSTRPIYKALQYSNDLSIPGVTDNEAGAISFLQQLGIPLKGDDGWRTFDDLEKTEREKLIAGVIMRRNDNKKRNPVPEDVFCNHYTLTGEKMPLLKNAREFSSFLNACGRLENANLGVAVCLGDEKKKKEAVSMYADYRREIGKMMRWFEGSKDGKRIVEGDNYIIINAKDELRYSMIGTLLSMTSRNHGSRNKFMLGLARMPGKKTKVSMRYCGDDMMHLKDIIDRIVESAGGQSGGHKDAAGAVIKTADESKFIEAARKEFESLG